MSEERVTSEIVWTPEQGLTKPEVRGISWNNLLLTDDFYGSRWRTESGVRVNADTALQSTVVLACCRILAETIAGLPVNVHRRKPEGDMIASEIPLHKILSFAPNGWQTKFEFFEQIVMHLCLWGNSYTRIRSGKYGSVSELDNLHPINMQVERLENGRLRYSYSNPETGRIERYTQDQIMHCRWTAEADGIKGMVPIQIAREAIALARACEIHAAKFWANSARPGVVLQTDGPLSAEAAQQLRDNWERIHAGVSSAYRTAVLTGGLKATELGFTNEASQFVASRAFQSEEIARVYRLPLSLLRGESGGNLEISGREFVNHTLMPWLRRIESSISRSLIYDDDEFYARFDVRELLRGDSNSRASYLSTMMNLGIYTLNDARRYEGLPPVGPDGDKHFIAMNVQTLEDAVKPKPDPMAMMGGGAPPPGVGGVPSLNEVKTGTPPNEAPKGEEAPPKVEQNAATPRAGGLETDAEEKYQDAIDVTPEYEDAIDVTPKWEEAIEVTKKKKPEWEEAIEIRSETLSPQNQDLYNAQMEIVEKDGKWPQSGADGAHYMEANPFEARGMACRNCIFFEKPGACHIVEGSIQPGAICKLWVIPEERLSAAESRARSTISIDFDRTFAANPKLWGEFAKQSVAAGNAVVMISRRPDTPKDRSQIENTLGEYAEAFSKVLLVGGETQKEDAAKAAGIKVDVWIDDAPHTIKGEGRAFCATGKGGGIDNSCGAKVMMAADDGGSNISGGSSSQPAGDKPSKPMTPDSIPQVSFRTSGVSRGEFMASRDMSDKKWNFSDVSQEQFDSSRVFYSQSGNSGCLLGPDGDIANVFNVGDSPGSGSAAVVEAIKAGAKTLDCYDGRLTLIYSQLGFVPVAKFRFVDEYAPKDWDYEALGRPDVVVMAYKGGDRSTIKDRVGSFPKYVHPTEYSDDFDEAKRTARLASDSHERGRRDRRGYAQGPGRRVRSFNPRIPQAGVRVGEDTLEARRLIDDAVRLAGPPAKSQIVDIGRAAAVYDHKTDSLLVSATVDSRAFGKAAEGGWVSQANPVLHELAHRHHFKADANSYECAEFISLTEEQQEIAKREVSRFAATNAREFVAEVIAGSMAGRKYGHAIQSMLAVFTDGKVALA